MPVSVTGVVIDLLRDGGAALLARAIGSLNQCHSVIGVLDCCRQRRSRALCEALEAAHRTDKRVREPGALQWNPLPRAKLPAGRRTVFHDIGYAARIVDQHAEGGLDCTLRPFPFDVALLMARAIAMVMVGGDCRAEQIAEVEDNGRARTGELWRAGVARDPRIDAVR